METLSTVGTILLIIIIIVAIGTAVYTPSSLRSAKAEDFLEKYYEEQGND